MDETKKSEICNQEGITKLMNILRTVNDSCCRFDAHVGQCKLPAFPHFKQCCQLHKMQMCHTVFTKLSTKILNLFSFH